MGQSKTVDNVVKHIVNTYTETEYLLNTSDVCNTSEFNCCRLLVSRYKRVDRYIYPSNAEATFVPTTRLQRFLKNICTLSCWYSLDSSHRVLSDEYPYARVSVISSGFVHHLVSAKLATSSIKVNAIHGLLNEYTVILAYTHFLMELILSVKRTSLSITTYTIFVLQSYA